MSKEAPQAPQEHHEGQPLDLPMVVIFEDQRNWYALIPDFVGDHPSLVIKTYEEATNFLSEQAILPEERRVRVGAFIVDGNLSEDQMSGIEGATIIRAIRENKTYDSIPVIGNSGNRDLPGADYNLQKKPDLVMGQLASWIQGGRPLSQK
ncbi:MAG: hypothetical protein ABI425_06170 [Patescibacteria group bacterium]